MSRKGYPSDKQDQFMLRLPDGMRDRIKAAAAENGRSMNGEIVQILEDHFSAQLTPQQKLLIAASGYQMIKRMVDFGQTTRGDFVENTKPLVWYVEDQLGFKPGREALEAIPFPTPNGEWITVEQVSDMLVESSRLYSDLLMYEKTKGEREAFAQLLTSQAKPRTDS